MKTILLSTVALLSLVFHSLAWGTTYYVGQNAAGRGDGISYSNRMSVSSHNSGSFSGGDTIYLCDTINSTVVVPSSGSVGSLITYRGDYAGHAGTISGAGYGVQITAKDYIVVQNLTVTNCTEGIVINGSGSTGSNYITVKSCTIYAIVNRGIFATTSVPSYSARNTNLMIGGEGVGNTVYDCGTDTAGYDIKVAYTDSAVISYNECYATSDAYGISGISWEGDATELLIEYNEVHDHNRAGGQGENGIGGKAGTDIIVRFNHVYNHNADDAAGIVAAGSWSNFYIYGNNVHDNSINIYAYDGPNGTPGYYYNDCGDGISPTGLYIWSNLIYKSGRWSGILLGSSNCTGTSNSPDNMVNVFIYNNVIAENGASAWNSQETGIHLRGNITDATIKNNIFYKNRPNENDYIHIYKNTFDVNGISLEHNQYSWPGETSKIYWDGYKTLTNIRALGQESIPPVGSEGIPGFVDAANNNYRLSDSSVCKYTGFNIGSEYADGLSPNHTNWDANPPIVKSERRREFGYWEKGAYVISDTGSLGNPVLRIKN